MSDYSGKGTNEVEAESKAERDYFDEFFGRSNK